MENLKLITEKQLKYINLMLEEVKKTKIKLDFELPTFSTLNFLNTKQAKEIINKLRGNLHKTKCRVINQKLSWKTLSNITIKKEWIIDMHYRSEKNGNSILVLIPDYRNKRWLELKFPKGGRLLDNEYGTQKKTGPLTFTPRPTKIQKKEIKMNDFLTCGVNLSWYGHFRWIPFDFEKRPILEEKFRTTFEDFIDLFEEANKLYKKTYNDREKKILSVVLNLVKIKQEKDIKNGEAGIHEPEVTETPKLTSLTKFNWLEDYEDGS
ncbi:hypothetical protein [Spiroplasma apis]|uniref:Uncharacterized protein n=1 Tax=Spiroplasma apis B31 TaxID=1276258 RepID=V5RHQ8_SPIAP|nr:hypothetical protein [Spiroplasma apis]AHB36069.1 hypothetical protein SAPIS_v1c02230 [Spiroplasma apis B31]